jgi:hypothetical protein
MFIIIIDVAALFERKVVLKIRTNTVNLRRCGEDHQNTVREHPPDPPD